MNFTFLKQQIQKEIKKAELRSYSAGYDLSAYYDGYIQYLHNYNTNRITPPQIADKANDSYKEDSFEEGEVHAAKFIMSIIRGKKMERKFEASGKWDIYETRSGVELTRFSGKTYPSLEYDSRDKIFYFRNDNSRNPSKTYTSKDISLRGVKFLLQYVTGDQADENIIENFMNAVNDYKRKNESINIKRYKRKFKEEDEESASSKAIKDLIDLNWGKDEDAQNTALQLFKGLVYANNKVADKFIQDVSDFTSKMNPDDYK